MVSAFLIGFGVGVMFVMTNFLITEIKEKNAKKNVVNKYKWWKTTCCYCGRLIEVRIPVDRVRKNRRILDCNACFHCVSENSRARNGIDESAWETREVEDERMFYYEEK